MQCAWRFPEIACRCQSIKLCNPARIAWNFNAFLSVKRLSKMGVFNQSVEDIGLSRGVERDILRIAYNPLTSAIDRRMMRWLFGHGDQIVLGIRRWSAKYLPKNIGTDNAQHYWHHEGSAIANLTRSHIIVDTSLPKDERALNAKVNAKMTDSRRWTRNERSGSSRRNDRVILQKHIRYWTSNPECARRYQDRRNV